MTTIRRPQMDVNSIISRLPRGQWLLSPPHTPRTLAWASRLAPKAGSTIRTMKVGESDGQDQRDADAGSLESGG